MDNLRIKALKTIQQEYFLNKAAKFSTKVNKDDFKTKLQRLSVKTRIWRFFYYNYNNNGLRALTDGYGFGMDSLIRLHGCRIERSDR